MPIENNPSPFKNLQNTLEQAAYFFLVFIGLCVPLSITATDFSMAIAAVLGILSGQFLRQAYHLKRNPIVWCTLWLFFLVIIATIWSIAPWPDRLSALHKYAKLLYIPLLLPLCTDPKWRDRTIVAFIIGVSVTVLLSFLKAWAGLQLGQNPNPAAVFYTHIETSFLVAFATYLLALYAWRKPRWRILCIILIVVFTYQEFFINDGRTGWVAYLILLLLFGIQLTGWKGLLLGCVAAMALGVGAYLLSPTFQGMVKESEREIKLYQMGKQETSLGFRLSFDSLSLHLIKERPILGFGAGSFAKASEQAGGVQGWGKIQTPHNEYMMILVEFGIVGLLSLLLLFAVQWWYSFSLGEMMPYAQGLLLVFMVSCFYNAFLYLTVSGHFFVFFTALFFGQMRCYFSCSR